MASHYATALQIRSLTVSIVQAIIDWRKKSQKNGVGCADKMRVSEFKGDVRKVMVAGLKREKRKEVSVKVDGREGVRKKQTTFLHDVIADKSLAYICEGFFILRTNYLDWNNKLVKSFSF